MSFSNSPTVYNVDHLIATAHECSVEIDGLWLAARPLGFQGLCLRERLHLAWMVFTGKYDALKWNSQ